MNRKNSSKINASSKTASDKNYFHPPLDGNTLLECRFRSRNLNTDSLKNQDVDELYRVIQTRTILEIIP